MAGGEQRKGRRCEAIKRDGSACKAAAVRRKKVCVFHDAKRQTDRDLGRWLGLQQMIIRKKLAYLLRLTEEVRGQLHVHKHDLKWSAAELQQLIEQSSAAYENMKAFHEAIFMRDNLVTSQVSSSPESLITQVSSSPESMSSSPRIIVGTQDEMRILCDEDVPPLSNTSKDKPPVSADALTSPTGEFSLQPPRGRARAIPGGTSSQQGSTTPSTEHQGELWPLECETLAAAEYEPAAELTGEPVHVPKKRRRKKPSVLTPEQQLSFARFWATYPRHEKREHAERAWAAIAPDEELADLIIAAVATHKAVTWRGSEMKFIPHPTSWLNAKRWEDEVDVSQRERELPRGLAAGKEYLENKLRAEREARGQKP